MSMTQSNIKGFSMIEVLVTILILMIGLLGLAGLQARALTAQMESYQRGQALFLLRDMADRINANRKNIASYLTPPPASLGTGDTQPAICPVLIQNNPVPTQATVDICEWSNALKGAAEKQGASNVGAMIGARGCIYQTAAANPILGSAGQYVVVVAWQGFNITKAPDVAAADSPGKCGQNLYMNKDGNPTEGLHRVISLPINFATLAANPI